MLDLYSQYRPFIKTGDFLDWRSDSLLGLAIRAKTGGEGNHGCLADRLTGLAGDRIFTLEALGGPYRPYYLSLRLREFSGKVWWYPLCDEWDKDEVRREIEVRMWAHVGTDYDLPGLFANAIRKVEDDDTLLFCYEGCFIELGFHGKVPVAGKEFEGLRIFKPRVLIYDSSLENGGVDYESPHFGGIGR